MAVGPVDLFECVLSRTEENGTTRSKAFDSMIHQRFAPQLPQCGNSHRSHMLPWFVEEIR